MSGNLHDSPGQATAEEGVVIVDGPDGIAASLTPDAARKMGRNLVGAARAARGQNEQQATTGHIGDEQMNA